MPERSRRNHGQDLLKEITDHVRDMFSEGDRERRTRSEEGQLVPRRGAYYGRSYSVSPSPERRRDRRGRHRVSEERQLVPHGGTYHGRSYSVSPSPERRHRRGRRTPSQMSTVSDRTTRSPSERQKEKMEQAVVAALAAGSASAVRSRGRSGDWNGEKGGRAATAAVTAAAIDYFLNENPDEHISINILAGTIGGLVANRLLYGAREK